MTVVVVARRHPCWSLRRPPAPAASPPPLAPASAFFVPAPRPTVLDFLVLEALAVPLATAVVRPFLPPSVRIVSLYAPVPPRALGIRFHRSLCSCF